MAFSPVKAVRTPKLHGLKGVTPTVQNSPSQIASRTAWQPAHRAATSVSAARGCKWHPHSSIAPAHIRQQSQCAKLLTGHLMGTTRLEPDGDSHVLLLATASQPLRVFTF